MAMTKPQNQVALSFLALFVVTAGLAPFMAVEGLHCYSCLAWMFGAGHTNERCRDAVPPSSLQTDCSAPGTQLLDLSTGKFRTLDSSTQAIGDIVCVKMNGTEPVVGFHYVVFRSCAIAMVEENLDGVCKTLRQEMVIETPTYNLTVMEGSKHWHCTNDNCNTGLVSGLCGDEGPGPGDGSHASAMLGSVVSLIMGLGLAMQIFV